MGAFKDPAKAAAALVARVPHAPRDVAARLGALRFTGALAAYGS